MKMEGLGPVFIIIGCYILMNTLAKIKQKNYTYAERFKSTSKYWTSRKK